MNAPQEVTLGFSGPFLLGSSQETARSTPYGARSEQAQRPRSPHSLPFAQHSKPSWMETMQSTARRRRIGKRKGPGNQELQRCEVGDPMVVTGRMATGFVGIASIAIAIVLFFALFLLPCFLCSHFGSRPFRFGHDFVAVKPTSL